jgi:hypothetical protein
LIAHSALFARAAAGLLTGLKASPNIAAKKTTSKNIVLLEGNRVELLTVFGRSAFSEGQSVTFLTADFF